MKQLSGTDSLFVSMETTEIHSHIGGLVILDPSASPDFGFEKVRTTLAERLPQAGPEWVSNLQESPLGLSRPYLVPDPHFHVSRHLHRIAVPAPGGMRELAEVAGFLHSQKIDRRLPLWEMWYIEGLEGGRVALYLKTHHALMDGMKGADLSVHLCDMEPSPAPRPEAAPVPAEDGPGALEQAAEGIGNLIALPGRVASYGLQMARRGVRLVPFLFERGTDAAPGIVPRLSFNGDLGPRRSMSCTSLPLDDIKAIKNAVGVKLNDVALEISGSAMKKYARRNDEEISGSLAVTCPISTRAKDDTTSMNKIANMMVDCATDIDDPFERLQKIHDNTTQAKELVSRVRETPINSIGEVLPPSLVNVGFRALGSLADLAGTIPSNATVSNVPGPPVQLYIAGAKVEFTFPMSVLATTQGLNFTMVSFLDRFDVGITVDPEMIPDAWLMAECVEEAFTELRDAVLGQPAPIEVEKRPADTARPRRPVTPERSIAAA